MKVPFSVLDFLSRANVVYPDRVAVVDEPDQPAPSWGSLTYAQVMRKAKAQAATLDELGIDRGARVAMISQNSARQYVSFFGVSGWGRIFVPINFRLAVAEFQYIIEHCGAEVVMIDPELADIAPSLNAKHIFILGEDDDKIWGSSAEPEPWEADEDATAVINYTSGTTARPKGVQQTHRALWTNATVFGWHAGVSDRDVYLHTLPQFHCNGWGHVFTATGMGVPHIILRQIDGLEILKRIDEHGVTYLCCAPAVLSIVLDALPKWEGAVPGRDKVRCIVAGAPPPTRTIERVREELGWEFIQIYGLTESSPLLTMSRMREEWEEFDATEQARHLGRAGAPVMSTQIMVSDNGEILAKSNTILESYWENPAATAEALDGGWFHTGDGGTLEEGYVMIADRKKDVIVSGGENVSSIEVEDAIASHPAVREVAVIGIPDDKWGESVLALVVIDEGDTTEQDIRDHVRGRLAGYKVPKRVEFRSELTRTATGKLQKFKLREEYWAGRERMVN